MQKREREQRRPSDRANIIVRQLILIRPPGKAQQVVSYQRLPHTIPPQLPLSIIHNYLLAAKKRNEWHALRETVKDTRCLSVSSGQRKKKRPFFWPIRYTRQKRLHVEYKRRSKKRPPLVHARYYYRLLVDVPTSNQHYHQRQQSSSNILLHDRRRTCRNSARNSQRPIHPAPLRPPRLYGLPPPPPFHTIHPAASLTPPPHPEPETYRHVLLQ